MGNSENYAMGMWTVKEGSTDEFLSRWRAFLDWTHGSATGFQGAHLLRSASDNRRFVSYSTWESPASQKQWRELPDFARLLGAVQAVCDDFQNDMYGVAMTVG